MQLDTPLRRFLPIAIVASAISGCAAAPDAQDFARATQPVQVPGAAAAPVPAPARDVCVQYGLASWYGPGPGARRTANGDEYRGTALTGAHRFLPFGTRVRVTNLATDRSVIVRIDDRGPFVPGRIIDLSRAAARELDMRRDGVVRVRLLASTSRSAPIPIRSPAGPLPHCTPRRDGGGA
jgi:peptidoglycan lytic transglycosylase